MMDDEFLQKLHHVLLEVSRSPPCFLPIVEQSFFQVHVEEGAMICPNCSHVYPISNGIPNMVSSPTC